MSKVLKVYLDGLHCAHCAGKIEEKVNGLDNVDKAVLNFVNKEMRVNLNSGADIKSVFNDVKNIVGTIEPSVKVTEQGKKIEDTDNESESMIFTIVRFVLGCGLFMGALFSDGEISRILYILSYGILGYDVIWRALKNISKGQVFDENFLMSIATLGAFYIGEYPEAVAVMLFYQIGEFFQDLAVDKSRKSIKGLMDISVETANIVKEDDTIETVSPESVTIGQVVLVKVGEKVPLDGIVVEGNSRLDMAALTGESAEVEIAKGQKILSGSINKSGVIKVRVEKEYKDSTVARIMDLVENAVGNKSKTENFITKFAKVYTPIVVGCAVLLTVVPTVIGGEFNVWLSRALVFLVSSCPCALVVSVPLTFFSGLGESSKKGVLIKGSNYLQALADVDTVVFDKTGTLTKGVFEVSWVLGENKNDVLKYAASIEKYSNHPVAQAIVNKYNGELEEISGVKEIGGHGLVGMCGGKKIAVGNSKLMAMENIIIEENKSNGTVVYVSLEQQLLGEIVVADGIREDSRTAMDKLKAVGIKELVMLTGDRKQVADVVAEQLGITRVYSELLPQDKVSNIEKLYNENKDRKIAFVGDGINDAPVLARVDAGVAMGGIGSDAAIEAADVVIMNDEISKLGDAIQIAKSTMKIAKQNVIFVLAVKLGVLLLAGLGFANMWLAVFADVGVALLAILNSMKNKI